MANQSLKTGRNISLEPMNPFERRIIHTAIQDVRGVTSWSVGEEPFRKVIIGTGKDNRNYRGGRGGYRKDGGNRRNEELQLLVFGAQNASRKKILILHLSTEK